MGDDEAPERRPVPVDIEATLEDAGFDRARLALWLLTVVVLLALVIFAWDFAGTLILGLFVYYVTRPVFDRIHGRVHNRTLAVATSLVLVALPVLVMVGWTVVVAVQALSGLLEPGTQAQVEAIVGPYLDTALAGEDPAETLRTLLMDPIGFLQTDLGNLAAGALSGLLASLGAIAGAGFQAFIVLVITFYLLRDDYRLAAWARGTFAREGSVVETYLVVVDRELQTVFFGNILNALVTGLIAVVTYFVLNTFAPPVVRIPQPALVGLLVGAASLVPAIGIKLVTWPLGAYLLLRSAVLDPETLWFPAVFFLVSFVVVDYIPDQLLRPYVSGRTLHVGAVMLAYLFGPILFGWYGIFLGPFLLVLLFEFGRIVLPWLVDADAEPPSGGATLEPAVGDAGAPDVDTTTGETGGPDADRTGDADGATEG